MESSTSGELRAPGKIRVLSGRVLDLRNLQPEDIYIEDIAWGLGRTLRYGGHIREDYTVAHHSIIMSYLVAPEYALEALLHDAAEAYIGDIIWPVKTLFPAIEKFENMLALKIMQKFDVKTHGTDLLYTDAGYPEVSAPIPLYVKSGACESADQLMLQHECFGFGRPGTFIREVEDAWMKAVTEHEMWWHAPTYAFLERYDWLTGMNVLDLDALSKLWFADDEHSERMVKEAEAAMTELGYLIPDPPKKEEVANG